METIKGIKTLKEVRLEHFLRVLNKCNGNRTKAAKHLGISVRTCRNYLTEIREEGFSIDLKIPEDPTDIEKLVVPQSYFPTNEERIRYLDTMPNGGNSFYRIARNKNK